VEFLGISVDPNSQKLYLVVELMERGTLRDVLEKKKANLTWGMRVKLASDAAKGMVYLHSRNIIHRDLKPDNLLVATNWVCKVADFGISTVSSRTTQMTCIGTPVYMAPEVLLKNKYSMKADVYSFGVVILQIFTDEIPYSGPHANLNQAQLMYKIVHEGLRPDIRPATHPRLLGR
jgi:serine/threonine protein kinase